MSELKVTSISHPSASVAGITLGSDGSVVLPSGFTGGLGTNVVQTVKTDTFSTTSTSFVDVTGLAVTITPTSATAKVLVSFQFTTNTNANAVHAALLLRDSTVILQGDAAGSRTLGSTSTRLQNLDTTTHAVSFLDSPNTTSAVTYKVQVRTNTGTLRVATSGDDTDVSGNVRGTSMITAIEVAT